MKQHERLAPYGRAVASLSEAVAQSKAGELSQLGQEGLIQRFECCMELAWNVMKDYLEVRGIALREVTPTAVIERAATAKVIGGSDGWLDALRARNKMSHTYKFSSFEIVSEQVKAVYLGQFQQLLSTLKGKGSA